MSEPAKKDIGLAEGYCARCDKNVMPAGQEYPHDHPEHFDGVSEFQCLACGRREGRWTRRVLTDGASEPRYGVEREAAIADDDYRKTNSG